MNCIETLKPAMRKPAYGEHVIMQQAAYQLTDNAHAFLIWDVGLALLVIAATIALCIIYVCDVMTAMIAIPLIVYSIAMIGRCVRSIKRYRHAQLDGAAICSENYHVLSGVAHTCKARASTCVADGILDDVDNVRIRVCFERSVFEAVGWNGNLCCIYVNGRFYAATTVPSRRTIMACGVQFKQLKTVSNVNALAQE